MGEPAREVGRPEEGTDMKSIAIERRQSWHQLSRQDKQKRLEDLRRRHQSQVEMEILRLQHHLR
jgi:hypothetical protein